MSVGELVVTVRDDVRAVADVDAQLARDALRRNNDGTIHERVTAAVASRAPSTLRPARRRSGHALTTGEGVTLRLDLGVGVSEIVVQQRASGADPRRAAGNGGRRRPRS